MPDERAGGLDAERSGHLDDARVVVGSFGLRLSMQAGTRKLDGDPEEAWRHRRPRFGAGLFVDQDALVSSSPPGSWCSPTP